CSHLGWDAGLAWVADEDRALRCRGVWTSDGFPAEEIQTLCTDFPPDVEALPARVVLSGEALWVSVLERSGDLPRREAFRRAGLRCAFLVPMRLGDETLDRKSTRLNSSHGSNS